MPESQKSPPLLSEQVDVVTYHKILHCPSSSGPLSFPIPFLRRRKILNLHPQFLINVVILFTSPMSVYKFNVCI
jgi:hypothetical protein